jgi:GDP-L-fucose synthase
MNNKIVIGGGSSMVGQALKKILPDAIYLSSKDYDLTNEASVQKMYRDLIPDTYIHLSAKVGGIMDNINKPCDYFEENVLMNTLLVKYARLNNVKKFIGILSSCIFPDTFETYPMVETDMHLGPPTPTNFSYGYAKRCLAVNIDASNKQHGTRYSYLTPCNLYGPNDKTGENSHFVAALINKIHQAKESGSDHIKLFGSGSPLRQFMYVDDFANIIKYVIDNDINESFNVAPSENISIHEIAKKALIACDAEYLNIEFDASMPDGQFRKDISNEKMLNIIKDFEFTPLLSGIKKTYELLK